ncbi:MAG: M48 family metalloprotease, partial [Candidatus Sericytochromatia bacterium]
MTTDASAILDDTQQARAKALARARRRWQLLELLVGVSFLAAMLATGASARLRDWALGVAPAWWAGLLLFSAAFFGLYTLLTLPLSYFSEYRLEKRYGLLKQGLGGWLADALKGLVVGAVIMGPLLLGLYAVLGRFPETWWLWAIGGYAAFTLVAIVAVPVVVMPLFHKFTPLEDPELEGRLQALAGRVGARVQGVYRWGLGEKSELANAALTGLGATRRIIVSDTMLDRYSPEEIEAVLAHELGHHCHADIWRMWAVNVGVTSLAFYLGHMALGRF